eukprot:5404308-Prymnesium_polylepis.1
MSGRTGRVPSRPDSWGCSRTSRAAAAARLRGRAMAAARGYQRTASRPGWRTLRRSVCSTCTPSCRPPPTGRRPSASCGSPSGTRRPPSGCVPRPRRCGVGAAGRPAGRPPPCRPRGTCPGRSTPTYPRPRRRGLRRRTS